MLLFCRIKTVVFIKKDNVKHAAYYMTNHPLFSLKTYSGPFCISSDMLGMMETRGVRKISINFKNLSKI